MLNKDNIKAYEIIEERRSEDVNSDICILSHKKTKARVVLVKNDDENKVFYIGFKTPPKDDTGVAHILEHSVLCGSKNFPLKDPFVELVKGSLNTFLNAMTYPDKTVYPVASCNDKDFQNLMNIYLDAVFFPNMREEKKIFMQEGWHYELENEDDDLKINGVVYNEMKGAFSNPDSLLDREVFNSLFPNTEYGNESGGHPDSIPDLTYEQFVEFHDSYYHPSNSYIYLYGNMDMEEKLNYIDENYLSGYDYLGIDADIAKEEAFSEIKSIKKEYPISEGESEENNTYLSYNAVVGNCIDEKLYIAFAVLDYVLCSVPGAPVKQALIDKGIGRDVYSTYENGIMQPYFSIIAKGANEADGDEFIKIIDDVLIKLVNDGIDKNALRAGLNCYEFRYREADFGNYPKGLIYGLRMLDSWLYDDAKPFINLEADKTYEELRNLIDTNYYEELIREYLINNNHKSKLFIVPKKGLTATKDKELVDKLQEYKKSLSKEEIELIIKQTKDLEEYQNIPNSKEDLEKIPLLTKEDIADYNFQAITEVSEVEGTKYIYHDIFTNKIAYIKLLFDMKGMKQELFPYVGLLKTVLGCVDTKNYTYNEFCHATDLATGGISAGVSSYINSKKLDEYRLEFEVKTKVFYSNIGKAFELIEEMIMAIKWEDTKRIKDIIAEIISGMQASMMSASHSVAASRAMAGQSEVAAVSEMMSGISFYNFMKDIDENFDERKIEVISNLKETIEFLFNGNRLMVDCTATAEVKDEVSKCFVEIKNKLYKSELQNSKWNINVECKNEGFKTSGQVQYVCKSGNFLDKGLPFTGALNCLKVMMGYEYLWSEVRVKGGAYGCMCAFTKTGNSYFVSYRDPNLTNTIDVYNKAADFVRNYKMDERTTMKFIIGAISDFDKPISPSARGSRSLSYYLSNINEEDILKERNEILSFSPEIAKGLADYIEAFVGDEHICVVGNEDIINDNEELFDEISNLL